MPFLTTGKSGTALLWTGSYAIPNGIEIGSGSGAKTASTTALVAPLLFRTFTSTDVSTPRMVTFTADFTSTQMSGINLREFAVKASGGALWSAEGFPAVTFDGSNELQIQVTWEVF